jgi:hypothetical protein
MTVLIFFGKTIAVLALFWLAGGMAVAGQEATRENERGIAMFFYVLAVLFAGGLVTALRFWVG